MVQKPLRGVPAEVRGHTFPRGDAISTLALDDFDKILGAELDNMGTKLGVEQSLQVLDHDVAEEDGNISAFLPVTRLQAAFDSGSVDNLMHLDDAPEGVDVTPNRDNNHFVRVKTFA